MAIALNLKNKEMYCVLNKRVMGELFKTDLVFLKRYRRSFIEIYTPKSLARFSSAISKSVHVKEKQISIRCKYNEVPRNSYPST